MVSLIVWKVTLIKQVILKIVKSVAIPLWGAQKTWGNTLLNSAKKALTPLMNMWFQTSFISFVKEVLANIHIKTMFVTQLQA